MSAVSRRRGSASNGGFFSSPLVKKIIITILLLSVYRLGSYVPVPYVDVEKLSGIAKYTSDGILGMLNMLSGGSLSRMSIFALTIVPYISASIVVQLSSASFDFLKKIKEDGSAGQLKIQQYTKYLAIIIAIFQGFAVAKSIAGMNMYLGSNSGGSFFAHFSVALTLATGTLFLMWLGDKITSFGIGNGVSLIIFVGIVIEFPKIVYSSFELLRTGVVNPGLFILLVALFVCVVIFIVFVEGAYRIVGIAQPKFHGVMRGNNQQQGVNELPLKLNPSGVIPPIFASSVLLLPATISSFLSQSSSNPVLSWLAVNLAHGKPLFSLVYAAMIVFFTYFYTSIVFDTKETANQLKKSNSFILGIRPGDATALYLKNIMSRLCFIGSAYLVIVCIIPEVFSSFNSQSFIFGGTSLLIIVNVATETISQARIQMMSKKYEKVLSKYKR